MNAVGERAPRTGGGPNPRRLAIAGEIIMAMDDNLWFALSPELLEVTRAA